MQARGQAMAEEFRGKGIKSVLCSISFLTPDSPASVMLGPSMDLMRSPKAGRAWESFGPDPWLAGEAAFATVQGVQSVGVVCARFVCFPMTHLGSRDVSKLARNTCWETSRNTSATPTRRT